MQGLARARAQDAIDVVVKLGGRGHGGYAVEGAQWMVLVCWIGKEERRRARWLEVPLMCLEKVGRREAS